MSGQTIDPKHGEAFMRCDNCHDRPFLCKSCLHNSSVIARLQSDRKYARDLYDHMSERLAELQQGACRFNCRSQKAMFKVGFRNAIWHLDSAGDLNLTVDEAYEEWRKTNDR